MTDDLISREAVLNTVFSMLCRWDTKNPDDLKNMLLLAFQELPAADAVPVVRCRDCRFADAYYHCVYTNFWESAEDYCSRGEKKYG